MKQGETKNYGCLAGLGFLLVFYFFLKFLVVADSIITKVLSNPLINYGVPVVILIIIIIKSINENKKK
jgi:hypothetical protein